LKMPSVRPCCVPFTWLNTLTGFAASVFNQVKGTQHGLTLGIFNFAHELHGVQVGILNYAGNNTGIAKLLPLVNAHH